jgi:hypothetical protein
MCNGRGSSRGRGDIVSIIDAYTVNFKGTAKQFQAIITELVWYKEPLQAVVASSIDRAQDYSAVRMC